MTDPMIDDVATLAMRCAGREIDRTEGGCNWVSPAPLRVGD